MLHLARRILGSYEWYGNEDKAPGPAAGLAAHAADNTNAHSDVPQYPYLPIVDGASDDMLAA